MRDIFHLHDMQFFAARSRGKRIGCGFLAVAVGWLFLASLKAHADPLLLVLLGLFTVLPALTFTTRHSYSFED